MPREHSPPPPRPPRRPTTYERLSNTVGRVLEKQLEALLIGGGTAAYKWATAPSKKPSRKKTSGNKMSRRRRMDPRLNATSTQGAGLGYPAPGSYYRLGDSARPRSSKKKTETRRHYAAGGSGLASTSHTSRKRKPARKKKVTFKDKVKKIIDGDKEMPSGLFAITTTNYGTPGNEGEAPVFHRITPALASEQITSTGMYCPTGVDPTVHTTTALFETAWTNSGAAFLPTQMVCRRASATDVTDPEYLKDQPDWLHYSGDSYNLKYLSLDWGWAEGSSFALNRKYVDVEVVCGFIRDGEACMDMMKGHAEGADPAPLEQLLNLALGPPGLIRGTVFAHSTLPKRSMGTYHHAEDDEDMYMDRSRFKKLFTILQRTSYRHVPQVTETADGADGVKAVRTDDKGKLFDEHSFTFPLGSGIKQVRQMTIEDSAGADVAETVAAMDTRTPQLKKNIPFIFVRGSSDADSSNYLRCAGADAPARNGVAINGLKWACQFKVKIADDE